MDQRQHKATAETQDASGSLITQHTPPEMATHLIHRNECKAGLREVMAVGTSSLDAVSYAKNGDAVAATVSCHSAGMR